MGHNSRNHHDVIICFDWWANPSMLSAIFIWSFSVFKSLVRQCITIVSGFYPNTRIYNLNFVPQISRFLLGDVIISSKANVFCGKNKQKRSNGKVKNKTVSTTWSFIWIPSINKKVIFFGAFTVKNLKTVHLAISFLAVNLAVRR